MTSHSSMGRRWGIVERFAQDLGYGWRMLAATPVVSSIAVLSLALGIGANTAIFSVLNTLLLRPLPVAAPGQLVLLGDESGQRVQWSSPVWEQVRARTELFDGAFSVSSTRFDLAMRGESEFVDGLWASGGMFEVLGVTAAVGRTFSDVDDRPGGGPDGPVAVISHAFWQRQFGGASDVIGRTLTLDRVAYTVVGVAPAAFFGVEVGRRFDVAVPVGTVTVMRGPRALEQRSIRWLRIALRLRPDQSVDEVTARLRAMQPEIRRATLPDDWHASTLPRYLAQPFRLEPAAVGDSGLRERYRRPLVTIMVVVGLVLLIACANLANVLLARAAARRHELALRLALGASPARVARQLLTESLLLASIGAAGGLVLAHWVSRLLVRQLSTSGQTVFLDLSLDWRVLGFTVVVALATAALFGTAPALGAARIDPQDAMKTQVRGAGGGVGTVFGQALVVVQVAVSLVLLVAAGLFLRTFVTLATKDPGFSYRPLLVAEVMFPGARVSPAERPAAFRGLAEAAHGLPSVSAVALSHMTPLERNPWFNLIELPDAPNLPELERLTHFNRVGPGWFATYGTPLRAGRDFTSADTPGSLPVAIVNEAFARKFAGGRNPVGMRVRHPGNVVREVVGLVGDAVYGSLRGAVPPTLYLALGQEANLPARTYVSVRVEGMSPTPWVKPLLAALAQVHPDAIVTAKPLAADVDAMLVQERMVAGLATLFAVIAVLLAGLGLYGLTSYAIGRRRSEIGIRMALGASPAAVVALMMRRTSLLIGLGVVLGTVVSWWASTLVSPLLFGLEPRDPATIAGALALIASLGLVAAWLPARRAAKIDPSEALQGSG